MSTTPSNQGQASTPSSNPPPAPLPAAFTHNNTTHVPYAHVPLPHGHPHASYTLSHPQGAGVGGAGAGTQAHSRMMRPGGGEHGVVLAAEPRDPAAARCKAEQDAVALTKALAGLMGEFQGAAADNDVLRRELVFYIDAVSACLDDTLKFTKNPKHKRKWTVVRF